MFTAPFVMAAVNTRVVRRGHALAGKLALDPLTLPGGVTTPSVAMAKPLVARLRRAGLTFAPRRTMKLLALSALLATWLAGARAGAQDRPAEPSAPAIDPAGVVGAHRLTGAIQLDGRLDEPAWQDAIPTGPFT